MDEEKYSDKLNEQNIAYEAMCKRCGECCGAQTDDPCSQLKRLYDGTYTCAVYTNRHGIQTSRSGAMFACVNIRDVIAAGAVYPDCPYFRCK